MPFQYFFFDTYVGYFLQVLPVALIVGIIYFIYKSRKTSEKQAFLPTLFVCYITGLISLTIFADLLGDIYYFLFYHIPSYTFFRFFTFNYIFEIRFIKNFTAENLGNILLFLPFGLLYPLFNNKTNAVKTILCGMLTSLVIEVTQLFLARSCDINDFILNTLGVMISTVVFYICKNLFSGKGEN